MTTKHKLIFVDPQDSSAIYWWPAIIVNDTDYNVFFAEMGDPIPINNKLLVCYFEDASYNTVNESDIMDYKEYLKVNKIYIEEEKFNENTEETRRWLLSPNVASFVKYILKGKIPDKFTWLKKLRKDEIANTEFRKKEILDRAARQYRDY